MNDQEEILNTTIPENEKEAVKPKKEKKHDVEIEKLTLEKNDLMDKVLRLTAEMQNMSRRYELEKSNIYKYDGEKLIMQILPIIDNFERAVLVDESKLTDELGKYLAGFKMIYNSLLTVIKNYGVTEIEAKGQEFDPTKMEAITTGHEDGIDSGIVLDVMQKGYMYNDKVIRVAMVKVNE